MVECMGSGYNWKCLKGRLSKYAIKRLIIKRSKPPNQNNLISSRKILAVDNPVPSMGDACKCKSSKERKIDDSVTVASSTSFFSN